MVYYEPVDTLRDIAPSLRPIVAEDTERPALERLEMALGLLGSAPMLTNPDGPPIELSPALYQALKEAAEILLRGDAVVISPVHRQLTTTEAADLLNISRQYLTRILDRGDLSFQLIGRHRRIKLSDLLAYKTRRATARRTIIDELTTQSEHLGVYD